MGHVFSLCNIQELSYLIRCQVKFNLTVTKQVPFRQKLGKLCIDCKNQNGVYFSA